MFWFGHFSFSPLFGIPLFLQMVFTSPFSSQALTSVDQCFFRKPFSLEQSRDTKVLSPIYMKDFTVQKGLKTK